MRTVRPMLLTFALFAGCQGASAPEGPVVPPVVPVDPTSVALSVRDGRGDEGPFLLTGLERLAVEVRFSHAAPGAHHLRLDVVDPGGALYAQLPVAVEVGADGEGLASQRIEVGGTAIERYRETGAWTFRLARSDGAVPLATALAEVKE